MNIDQFKVRLQEGELLTQRQISYLADKTINILSQQSNIIQVSSPQYIVGDVHGQFYDFLKMIKQIIPSNSHILFLGDYVDRGYHSIQTICYLFTLKCLKPNQIVMIRGNHETSTLTRTYGFYDEVQRKYGNHNVWGKIIQIFTYLPLAAVVDNQVLCVHGGLSPSLPFIQEIIEIDRVRDIPESGPMSDIVWSDPDPSENEGWTINNRGAGFLFSKQVVKEFLELNNLKSIVRAHQLVEEGHIYNFGDESFITLWSAPNYCYRCGNIASVMKVAKGEKYQFLQFGPSQTTTKKKIHFDNILPYFL